MRSFRIQTFTFLVRCSIFALAFCPTLAVFAEEGSTATISPLATQGPRPKPITPPTTQQIQKSLERGVDFLLETQRENGAWGSAETKKKWSVFAPLSGSHFSFRTAVTSLSLTALVESQDRFSGERHEAVGLAIERGQTWLLEHGTQLRRIAPDARSQTEVLALYNVWGHAYATQALVRLHRRAEGDSKLQEKIKKVLVYQVDQLRRCAFLNGGWGYYDMVARTQKPSGSPIGFTTATVLIALKEAEELGVSFPKEVAQQAIDSIVRQRFPDYAYAYGEYLRMAPRADINRPAASIGRSQVCNLALRMYGDSSISDEVLKTWLDRLYARIGWLSMSRKRFIMGESPHKTHIRVAGYFFHYGLFYAAMCIDELPEDERPYYQDHLANILLPFQEKDGSWWDFPLYSYHQQYGTAMSIYTLVHCLHDRNHSRNSNHERDRKHEKK